MSQISELQIKTAEASNWNMPHSISIVKL